MVEQAGGGGREQGRVPPDAFHRKSFADLPGKERQGKKRGMEKKRRKIVKGKVEN